MSSSSPQPASGVAFGPEEVGILDWPHGKVVMACTNAIEAAYRIGAFQKEPWQLPFLTSIPQGGVFYDIGACEGSYSLPVAMRGITTVAFEPSAPNYGALVKNAMLNNCLENMLILPVALTAGRGLAWLDYSDVRPGAANHVIGSPDKIFYHRQRVMIFALDEMIEAFHLPMPTHMKVDTDGGEGGVLSGMDQTLRHERLVGLMIEMPLTAEAQIAAYLEERGWLMAERFDERGGIKIEGIAYARFARPVAAAEKPRRGKKAVAA